MEQQEVKANNVNLDLINWLLTKEGNPNAEINFKRVVEILAQYRDEFKIIDNIRFNDKMKELWDKNQIELNEIKQVARHQNALLQIEREENKDLQKQLKKITKTEYNKGVTDALSVAVNTFNCPDYIREGVLESTLKK
jgi:Asp-tRNA(Asn)/Glu-tRNA(Gln) amidotransferase C subunit